MTNRDLPAGLRMALLQNRRAMDHFEAMTEYEQNSVIQWAHNLRSKEEMEQLASNIAGGNVQNFHNSGTNRNQS